LETKVRMSNHHTSRKTNDRGVESPAAPRETNVYAPPCCRITFLQTE
jgi:hypothetical protein